MKHNDQCLFQDFAQGGQIPTAKIQGGGGPIQIQGRGDNHIVKVGKAESQFLRGREAKAPSEMDPDNNNIIASYRAICCFVYS